MGARAKDGGREDAVKRETALSIDVAGHARGSVQAGGVAKVKRRQDIRSTTPHASPLRSAGPARSKLPERHTPRNKPFVAKPLPNHKAPDSAGSNGSGVEISDNAKQDNSERQEDVGGVNNMADAAAASANHQGRDDTAASHASFKETLPELKGIHRKESDLVRQLREIDHHLLDKKKRGNK